MWQASCGYPSASLRSGRTTAVGVQSKPSRMSRRLPNSSRSSPSLIRIFGTLAALMTFWTQIATFPTCCGFGIATQHRHQRLNHRLGVISHQTALRCPRRSHRCHRYYSSMVRLGVSTSGSDSKSKNKSNKSAENTAAGKLDDLDLPSSSNNQPNMTAESFEQATVKSKVSAELDNIMNTTTGESPQPSIVASATKFRRLKDLMWVRETLEDMTAAEFACSVESAGVANQRKRKRAVDYDKLVVRLDARVRDMCGPDVELEGTEEDVVGALEDGRGMGKIVYTQDQRLALLTRLFKTRKTLSGIARGLNIALQNDKDGSDSQVAIDLSEIPELKASVRNESISTSNSGPKLYVRDDGTLDWDGALQDRAALKEFGVAVWARINGQIPSEEEEGDIETMSEQSTHAEASHKSKQVTAKIEDTPAIIEAREELDKLQKKFKLMQDTHMALLNSGISAGQVVANVKLASLDVDLRNKIRQSAEKLEIMDQKVSFQTLIYELERIYTYLATEVANPASPGYVPLQDRLNIAEFGLLESQIDGFSNELKVRGSFDADVLAVVMEQLVDFKRRLGIDYYVTGLTYDREAIRRWLNDLWSQTKSGLAFYVKGCRLFWNDIVFCVSLIGRAAQGYTLKPREVRTIRRTFKDIITFIPVVIILIIPLTPIGHVLVFGAIQRFFPDFFPSCFTEQRQNLLQLYETTEYSEFTINENWQEKIVRIFKAAVFFVVSKSRSAYVSLRQSRAAEKEEDPTDSSQ